MKQEDFLVKEMDRDDVDLAVHFRQLLFEEIGSEEEEMIEYATEEVRRRYIEEYKKGRIRHFVAYNKQGEAIGITGALLKSDFPYYLFTPGYYGWIIDVYTKPEYRGNQIATTLLQYTHNWLVSVGAYESKLIAVGKKPKELYEKLGYRSTWEMSLNLNKGHKTYNEIIDENSSEKWPD
ncbi:GNAT family N-acetyltransferase [Anaerosporobacter sp.]